jgi:hypothetical protein
MAPAHGIPEQIQQLDGLRFLIHGLSSLERGYIIIDGG